MKNQRIIRVAEAETTPAELLLLAAGVDFTVVARCPVGDCPVCAPPELSVAA